MDSLKLILSFSDFQLVWKTKVLPFQKKGSNNSYWKVSGASVSGWNLKNLNVPFQGVIVSTKSGK